jgi:hypothetical protein
MPAGQLDAPKPRLREEISGSELLIVDDTGHLRHSNNRLSSMRAMPLDDGKLVDPHDLFAALDNAPVDSLDGPCIVGINPGERIDLLR